MPGRWTFWHAEGDRKSILRTIWYLLLAVQRADAPGKGSGEPHAFVLEMTSSVSFQRAVLFAEMGFEQFILAPDGVSHPGDSAVLYVLLPVAEAQINL